MNDNPTPIILNVYGDLLKTKQRLELKIEKLRVRIRVLNNNSHGGSIDDKSFVLLEKLVIELEKALESLEYINHELELFEHRLNGGASLDKFLETGKVESE